MEAFDILHEPCASSSGGALEKISADLITDGLEDALCNQLECAFTGQASGTDGWQLLLLPKDQQQHQLSTSFAEFALVRFLQSCVDGTWTDLILSYSTQTGTLPLSPSNQ